MEFEKAVYRIYEKTVEGFTDHSGSSDRANKYCKLFEFIVLSIAVFYLWNLIYIHHMYVGRAGCLPSLLQGSPLELNSTVGGPRYTLPEDQLLLLNLEPGLRNQRQPAFISDNYGEDESGVGVLSMIAPLVQNALTLGGRWLRETATNGKFFSTYKNRTLTHIDKWENYTDYEFVREPALVILPQNVRVSHKFKAHNVTLDSQLCFGSDLMQMALPSDGIDVISFNIVTFTFLESGMFKSSTVRSYRNVLSTYYSPFGNFGFWLNNRISVLFRSLLSFVFISTSTSLMIRVLVSSGVVLIFPIFWLFMALGADRNLLSPRMIALSYPWIGIPMEVIESTGASSYPFLISHFIRLVVYYFMFQATQLLMSLVFYDDNVPGMVDMWLFALVMTSEYYSMVYVRSVKSIHVFPRMTLAFFLLYHFYIYLHPTGFHLLALWVFFVFELLLMLLCVTHFEIPAFERGEVTIDSPRALTNSLPWPSWPVALAPDYTLFLPVSHRSTNIYGSPTGTQPVAAIENNEIDIADREVEANGIAMNPLHSQRRETRADSEESLDVEVGSGLAPIVIRSSTAGAERSTRRGPRPPQTYVALSASDDSNTINDDRSSY